MSCCNFDGQGTLDKLDPETQRITEAIYSDWTEAAGHPDKPLSPVPDIGGRSADDEFNPNPPITPTSGRMGAGAEGCQTDEDCPQGQRCNEGDCVITTRSEWRPGDVQWNFDGAAVTKNWVPLVVLGLSLVIGIGISEWASKKYIK